MRRDVLLGTMNNALQTSIFDSGVGCELLLQMPAVDSNPRPRNSKAKRGREKTGESSKKTASKPEERASSYIIPVPEIEFTPLSKPFPVEVTLYQHPQRGMVVEENPGYYRVNWENGEQSDVPKEKIHEEISCDS